MKTGLRLFLVGLGLFASTVVVTAQTITSAGKNHLSSGSTATLTGSISGGGSVYSWSVVTKPASAPNPVIADPSSLSTSVSNLVFGTYKFRLAGNGAGNYQDVFVYVTGSHGAPLINVDFGTGLSSQTVSDYLTSVGSSGTTGINYYHDGGPCPSDNWYSILPRTASSCFAGTWLDLTDRTGNTNGRFLVVNANYQNAGTYYEQTLNNLCPGNAYEFSAWIADLNDIRETTICAGGYTPVDITFSVYNGNTLLFSKNTGTVTPKSVNESDAWRRYSGSVVVPSGVTSLRLVITSIQGGCGTDFGMDDIQLTPYGPTISISIPGGLPGPSIYEYPYGASFTAQATPQSITLEDGTPYTFQNPAYQWQHRVQGVWTDIPGQTSLSYNDPSFQRADSGLYRIVMANQGNINNASCNVYSNEIRVKGPDEVPLPISLGDLSVSKQGSSAVVKWTTLSEKENAYFEVYRSTDGINFDRVGTVLGNGTTNQSNDYAYTDKIDGLTGTIYYRLKDIDIDGRGTFSKIVSLHLSGGTDALKVSVYPNPFSTNLKVLVNSKREAMATVKLTNVAGQQVAVRNVLVQRGQNIVVLPELEKLNRGVYVIEVITEEGSIVEKVIKN